MLLVNPIQVQHIAHPLVESVYLKKEITKSGKPSDENILVIKFKDSAGTAKEREEGILDFLSNLDLIRDQIERKTGKFKRVDIQRH